MRKTIKSERSAFRKKRFFELTGTIILLSVAVILLCNGLVLNPFQIMTVKEEEDIQKAYEEHVSYVRLQGQTLDFTGYYRLDSKGDINYNCYVTTDFDTKYFVFLPVESTTNEQGETKEKVTDYDLVGRIKKDQQLIETVAGDYEVTSDNFVKECSISMLVIDEAGAKRKEVLIIWMILFGMLFSYMIYIVIVLFMNGGMGGKRNGQNQA